MNYEPSRTAGPEVHDRGSDRSRGEKMGASRFRGAGKRTRRVPRGRRVVRARRSQPEFEVCFSFTAKEPGGSRPLPSSFWRWAWANLAVLNLVNALLLRPLPLQNAEELVQISSVNKNGELGELPSTFLDSSKQVPDYQSVCGFDTRYPAVGVGGTIVSVGTLGFSGDCFRTLGINVQLGRGLTPQDETAGAEPVAVITDAFWRRQFAGQPSALDKRIRMEGQAYTVVGAAEPRFTGLLLGFSEGVIITLSQEYSAHLPNGRKQTYWWVNILARGSRGVSEQAALVMLKARATTARTQRAPELSRCPAR